MAYNCPRCGKPVTRSSGSAGTGMAFGAAGVLLAGAFGGFNCPSCGKIRRSEFPPEVRNKMAMGSLGLVAIAVGIVVLAIWLIATLQR